MTTNLLADTLHAQSSSCNKFHMFGLLNAITGGGKVLSLTDNSGLTFDACCPLVSYIKSEYCC